MRKPYKKISYKDRQAIEQMFEKGATPKELAAATGVHIATIYRELQRGDKEGKYSAELAQREIFK